MKGQPVRRCLIMVVGLLLLALPTLVRAQAEQTGAGPPPVEQKLVREGEFAVKLLFALGVGTTDDEVEAESQLGELGILPRNGWIADYPVTPDIIAELEQAVGDAADAGKLSLTREDALTRLEGVKADFGVAIKPYAGGPAAEAKPAESKDYPTPTVINNYYYEKGPPVVTYYAPPPDYYYLYSWVPSPFWWFGFWFPGFFILNDFHRVAVVSNRVVFVSNHFTDVRRHRVFRVDPVQRFRGRTFAGIGVTRTREFINTGVPRSDRTIFNGPRTRMAPGMRTIAPPPRRGGVSGPSPRGAITRPSPRGGREMIAPQPRGGRMGAPPSGGRGPSSRGQRR